MDGFKSLLTSKTFWGGMVSIGGMALSVTHYRLSPADAASLTDLLSGIAAGIGGVIAIYGRIAATKKIGTVM